jgi:hypothetical protein
LCVDVHTGHNPAMDVRLDPMTEPMRCAHGREFIVFDGDIEWLAAPCASCAGQKTVADTGRAA